MVILLLFIFTKKFFSLFLFEFTFFAPNKYPFFNISPKIVKSYRKFCNFIRLFLLIKKNNVFKFS